MCRTLKMWSLVFHRVQLQIPLYMYVNLLHINFHLKICCFARFSRCHVTLHNFLNYAIKYKCSQSELSPWELSRNNKISIHCLLRYSKNIFPALFVHKCRDFLRSMKYFFVFLVELKPFRYLSKNLLFHSFIWLKSLELSP